MLPENYELILSYGERNVHLYDKSEFISSLTRAFKEKQFDSIMLDSFITGQKFLAACAAWAFNNKLLYCSSTDTFSQSECYTFKLTDLGKMVILEDKHYLLVL